MTTKSQDMKPKTIRFNRLALALLCIVLTSVMARGDEFDDLKMSIQTRMPAINAFKHNGDLKEGPSGFLAPSPEASVEARKAAEVENAARLRMFDIVATRSGTPVEEVAKRFAEMVPMPGPAPTPSPTSPPSSRPAPSERGFVPVSEGSSLPLNVLTRPSSSLYAEPSESSKVLNSDVPAFTAWVVAVRENGWYKVTEKVGKEPAGWMKESDVMEWRHHMVVSFTHPGNRSRNLVFKDKAPLASLLRLPETQRKPEWDRRVQANAKKLDEDTVYIEPPGGWIREKNQFYLLPILDQQEVMDAGQEMMLLKVAAATRERGSAKQPAKSPTPRVAPKMDIVFVMDLTLSMGRFVTNTVNMLNDIVSQFDDSAIGQGAVRFGLWGYRDDPNLCHGIEFNTHNFTPEMQDLNTFIKTLGTVRETKVDSIDYAEDVFAGVADAIQKTTWREGSVRSILLVGDAPGRGPGEVEMECHKRPRPEGTACGMDASALRQLATANSVYVAAYFLEASQWKIFTERATAQFKTLALNPGSQEPAFKKLNGDNSNDYATAAETYASRLAEDLKNLAQAGKLPTSGSSSDGETTPQGMADNLFRGAFLEWNSSNSDLPAPRDIQGWMTDKDPTDPAKMSLEPGVLLTKTQLSDLRDRVNDVLDAMLKAEVSGQDFFKELNAVVTIGGRDPGRLREAKTLMESDHFPDFLNGLPYKSKIMGMTRDDWREMGPDRANQYRNEIVSKVGYYAEIYKDASKWRKLNSSAETGEYVTPIPIDMLP